MKRLITFLLIILFPLIGISASAYADLSLSITTISNASCGRRNGILIAVVSGGAAPYSYSINNSIFRSNAYFGNLPEGLHTITVKDATGATASANATIINNMSPPQISVSYTVPSSCSALNGTITANGSGGTPPYEYSIDAINFQFSNTFTNLSVGYYDVFIRDANGCGNMAPSVPVVNFFSNCLSGVSYGHANCGNNGQTYPIGTIRGGTPPYQYSVDGGVFQNQNEFFNLSPGIHLFTIRDANGTINKFSLLIRDFCNLKLSSAVTHATCSDNYGTITMNPGAGTPPYLYSIDGINYQSSNIFTNLLPGNYTVFVKDANNITVFDWMTIATNCIGLSTSTTNTTCGGNNGIIMANVTNGNPPFQYSLDGVNFQNSNTFSSLPAGTYQVTVRDVANFTAITTATINAGINNLGLTTTAQATTCLLNDGSFTINATGGTPPYEYSKNAIDYQSNCSTFTQNVLNAAINPKINASQNVKPSFPLNMMYKSANIVAPNNLYNAALKVKGARNIKGPKGITALPYLNYFGK